MPAATTFTYTPSVSSRGSVKPRKLKAQFGNGYVQDAGDGPNGTLNIWEVVFQNIPFNDADTTKPSLKKIDDFLRARAGYERFNWMQPPPFDVDGALLFVCERWDWTYSNGLIAGVSATFEQRAL